MALRKIATPEEMDPSRPKAEEMIPANDPYPLPSQPQLLIVTPEMASSWLAFRDHPKNRLISKAVSSRYQADMEAGRWREGTPEGYIFDTEGHWISGRHRARAQANANATLQVWIFPNQPRDIAPFLDQGFRRSAAHVIRLPYAKELGAGAKHLAALEDQDQWGMPRFSRVMVPETVETFGRWPELAWHVGDVYTIWRATGIPAGAHLAVLAQAARTKHRDRIPAWLKALRTGAGLNETDPRLVLRARFIGGFTSVGKVPKRDQMYAQIVKAWNAYVQRQALTGAGLRLRVGELLPTVAGFSFETKENVA